MGVWLLLIAATPLVIDHAGQRAVRASDAERETAAQPASIRLIALDLDAAARAPAGAGREAALEAARREILRLNDLESRRSALLSDDAAAGSEVAKAALATLGLMDEGMDETEARRQSSVFARALAPVAERDAIRTSVAAQDARRVARLTIWAAFALNVAALVGLGALVAAPARRRLDTWVAANREAGREDRFQMMHDPVTKLPNSTYLRAYLAQISASAERETELTAIYRLDLDKFKTLRETLGQRAANEIVRITARRLRQSLRAGDFAAYLGQDDFVVIAKDLPDASAVTQIAARFQHALGMPFSLPSGARRLTCSIGVALASDDEVDPERMLANAEIALGEAQALGPGNIHHFRKSLRAEAEKRETLYTELLGGLTRGELVPFFQPQIDLVTGAVSGFEALVRWRHPTRGLLPPGAFLDFAEQAELTERIGEVVLAQSLAALTAWDAAGLHVPKIGVNFALGQLRDPRLIERIKWEVERNDIEPRRISIEVLETVLITSDTDMVVRNLRGLASAGFMIELDDFGTGHASIQNLRRFMVNRIKIDRSFIFGIETSEESLSLTASMIAMAKALGIRTVAEGVETETALAMLQDLGCDHAQGYLIAKPMSQTETFRWLANYRARPAAMTGDPNTA